MVKARKHTAEQIVNVLRQIEVAVANGKTTPAAGREAGITEQTYYRWMKEYGGLKGHRGGKLLSPERRRCAVSRGCERGMSERWACRLVNQPRGTQRYQPANTWNQRLIPLGGGSATRPPKVSAIFEDGEC